MFVKEYPIVHIITINLFLPHSTIGSTLELCPIYLYVPSIQSRAWQMAATQIYILIENLLDEELNEKQGWREKTMFFSQYGWRWFFFSESCYLTHNYFPLICK